MSGIDPEIVKRATLAHVNASRGAHGLSPLDRLPWTDHCDSVYGYTRAALEAVAPLIAAKAWEEGYQACRNRPRVDGYLINRANPYQTRADAIERSDS